MSTESRPGPENLLVEALSQGKAACLEAPRDDLRLFVGVGLIVSDASGNLSERLVRTRPAQDLSNLARKEPRRTVGDSGERCSVRWISQLGWEGDRNLWRSPEIDANAQFALELRAVVHWAPVTNGFSRLLRHIPSSVERCRPVTGRVMRRHDPTSGTRRGRNGTVVRRRR